MEKRSWIQRIWTEYDKRWAFIATVVYIALVIGTTAYRAAPGLYVDELFLRKRGDALIGGDGARISMTRGDDEADFTYRFYGGERTAHMTVTPEVITDDERIGEQIHVQFSDGTSVDATRHKNRLVDEEGLPLYLGNRFVLDSYHPGKPEITEAMYRLYRGDFESRGAWQMVFFSVISYALAFATWMWPDKVAFFGRRWQFDGEPELSDAGLAMQQLGGVLLAVMAVVVLFIPV